MSERETVRVNCAGNVGDSSSCEGEVLALSAHMRRRVIRAGTAHASPAQASRPFRYFHSSPEVIGPVATIFVRFLLGLRDGEDLPFRGRQRAMLRFPLTRYCVRSGTSFTIFTGT